MDFRTIKKLIELVEQSSKVTELSVEQDGVCIRVSAHATQPVVHTNLAPVVVSSTPTETTIAQMTTTAPAAATTAVAAAPTIAGTAILSPMVGIFYASPAPGAKSF
ncbi:MAG: acetyl-CoA carboxylase biotin carboxyl carrier protein, partial [Pseudomonadota bacterium]